MGESTTFGSYNSLGEAFHIAHSLKQHMRFMGDVFIEERLSLTEQTTQKLPYAIRTYEIPNSH